MLIVSQDKEEVINTDNVFRFYVDEWNSEQSASEPDCWCVRVEKATDNMICVFLGEYKTKERAKQVIQEIIRHMKNWENLKAGQPSGICSYIYSMPEE